MIQQYTMNSTEDVVGKKFCSFKELRTFLEDYEKTEKQLFTTAKCDKLPVTTEPNSKNSVLVYKYIRYECKFGNERKSEATGIRQTSTCKQGCSAFLMIGLTRDHEQLVIKKANLNHANHPASKVFYDLIPENRRLSPESNKETMKHLMMGCNKKLLQCKIMEEKQQHVTLKDLSNMKCKLKAANEDNLPNAVQLLERKYGSTVRVLEEENNFKGLIFVTEAMKNSMSAWPEIVFIDGTYMLLKNGLTVMLLIVQDSTARSEVVGVALLASEDRPTFTWLLESFKDIHTEACTRMHCIMSDKDLLERDVLKVVFPGIPVYICRFHTLKTFSRVITTEKMKISKDERNTSLRLLQQLVYSSSESAYDKLYIEFVKSVPKSVSEYFNKNWHTIKGDWTTYSMVHGNLNNLTNNRLESMNAKIKQVVPKNSSLLVFIESFFKWLQSHNLQVSAKTANAFLKKPVGATVLDSDKERYRSVLMPPSFSTVQKQMNVHQFITNITCYEQQKKECKITSNNVGLNVTPLSCECAIWTSEFVPCRHIFAVRKLFGLSLFDDELCQRRCTKRYVLENRRASLLAEPDHSTTKTGFQPAACISKVVSRKPKTASEKRKKITPIAMELVNLAATSCGTRFDNRTAVLKQICELWREGYEVKVTKSGDIQKNANEAATANEDERSSEQLINATIPEVNNNLAKMLDSRCSLTDPGEQTPQLTVMSNGNLSQIKMPARIKTFGRPSGYLSTTSGVIRRKNTAEPFAHKLDEQKIADILSWLIDGTMIDTVMRAERLICKEDLNLNELKDSIVDESVDLNLISPYFESHAFASLAKAVDKKKRDDILTCRCCQQRIVDNSVECDHCLMWYHYSCVQLRRAPRAQTWFCFHCKPKK